MTTAVAGLVRMLPRFRMGPASRVSLGLCSLMLAGLLALDFVFGVLPNPNVLLRELRERISEQVATQTAAAIAAGDPRALHRTLQQALEKDPQLLSIAVRRRGEQILAQAGPHAAHWKEPDADRFDLDHARVALTLNDRHWGDIEISFQPHAPVSVWGWLRDPRVFLVLALGLGAFVLFTLYLRRVFHYLDPAAVIPDRVRMAFDGFTEGVMVVDASGRIVLANAALRRWVERANTTLYGQLIQNIPWMRSALPPDPADYPWMRAMALNAAHKGEQLELPQESAEPVKTVVNCAPINDARGKVRGCIVTFDDVTALEHTNARLRAAMADLENTRAEIERQNKELRHLATRDSLTGCLNRRAFFEQAERLFQAARDGNQPLCCIMADIDHFKSFNDRYGHAVGDRVLRVVARALSGGLRDTDLLGRYGGEEFCILLPGIAMEEACAIAERLRSEVESHAGKGIRTTQGIVVTCSFGVSALDPEAADLAELIDQADKALYAAKNAGRNRVVNTSAGAIV